MSTPEPVESQDSGRGTEVRKVVALLAALVVVLGFYFLLLGRISLSLIRSGDVAAIIIGVGVLILPLLGVWMVVATVRSALSHQHLARRIHDEGLELDTSELPRRPSGRIERAAADKLFDQVKQEWEADPDNWRVSYRLARAYDYAGDRTRARETMRRAVELEKLERE
ncbi:tetratricopeptide repeat protein [Nocardia sp. KC 131]|uniref:tetratricopeptide repeat protein n=1 Tax=Nocardia arseniciresistens TaxID=3392119 RepID=UPI00398EE0C3